MLIIEISGSQSNIGQPDCKRHISATTSWGYERYDNLPGTYLTYQLRHSIWILDSAGNSGSQNI